MFIVKIEYCFIVCHMSGEDNKIEKLNVTENDP